MLSPVRGSISGPEPDMIKPRAGRPHAHGRVKCEAKNCTQTLPLVVPNLCRTTGPFENPIKVWCEI